MLYNSIAFNLEFFVVIVVRAPRGHSNSSSAQRRGVAAARQQKFFWICDNNCVDKFLPKNKAMTILMPTLLGFHSM